LSDLPEQTGLISDWMPVEDPAFIGDHVRHDWNQPGLIRHSGECRNPESSPFWVNRTAQLG
jgi:hypothetical protein